MSSPIPQRSCGDCAMCCHLGEIPDFKPFNEWCKYCTDHHSCGIYPSRPQPCRDFNCHWLLSDVSDDWYPAKCGFIVSTYSNPPRLIVAVDPETPDSWRQPPFIDQIHHWAHQGAVMVRIGEHVYGVTPNTIEDLGRDSDDTVIMVLEQETLRGVRYVAKRRQRGAPLNPA